MGGKHKSNALVKGLRISVQYGARGARGVLSLHSQNAQVKTSTSPELHEKDLRSTMIRLSVKLKPFFTTDGISKCTAGREHSCITHSTTQVVTELAFAGSHAPDKKSREDTQCA